MIIFDSSYLVVFLNPHPPAAKDRNDKPVEKFKERVEYLTAKLNASNEPIGIPAPAMAEVLVRAGKARSQMVSILSDRWRFQILPFDSRAAIEASELIAQIKSSGDKWETWAKVKFDIQIVSIAMAENATVIYADDTDIEKYAKRVKIPVMRICDLEVPPPPVETGKIEGAVGSQGVLNLAPSETNLEPQAEVNPDAAETGRTEESHKLQADPAYPTPVQGSDSGRAQGEAAAKEPAIQESEGKVNMSGAIIEYFPDETGCPHNGVGMSSPEPRKINGKAEVGRCIDCNLEIAFLLDQSGKRTGERRIVRIREVADPK